MRVVDRLTKNNNIETLSGNFKNSVPAPMIVIDDFLPEDVARDLSKEIDLIDKDLCRKFTRNGSYMEECNDVSLMPKAYPIISELHSQPFMKWLNQLTGIKYLIPDPYLVGAGYSRSFKGDSLKNHVDFNWNDSLKLYRALTIVIYLSEDWDESWGGHLEFSNFDNLSNLNTILVKWNRAVIWQHHENCFHGYPKPIECPEGHSRKTLRLFYYTSNQEPSSDHLPHRSLYWIDQTTGKPTDNKLDE